MKFVLLGQAKDVFKEVAFMAKLEKLTGHVFVQYFVFAEEFELN